MILQRKTKQAKNQTSVIFSWKKKQPNCNQNLQTDETTLLFFFLFSIPRRSIFTIFISKFTKFIENIIIKRLIIKLSYKRISLDSQTLKHIPPATTGFEVFNYRTK